MLGERYEITVQYFLDVRIRHRRGRTFVLADFAGDVARKRNPQPWQLIRDSVADGAFVRRVPERMKKDNRHRPEVAISKRLDDSLDILFVRCSKNRSIGKTPFIDLKSTVSGNKRPRQFEQQVVHVESVFSGNVENVAKSAGHL
jgi:hypothetical protein